MFEKTNSNANTDYKKTLLDNLKYMDYSKHTDNETQSEFEKNSFENKIPSSVLDNSTFRRLFDIAWKNCENEEKTINEMNSYIDQIDEQFQQAEVLDQVIIAYQLLTTTSKEQFYKNDIKYIKALRKIAQNRTSSFIRSHKNEKLYDLIPIEKKFDKFSAWEIDRLCNHMKVYLIRPNLIDLPELWRTNEKTQFLIEEKTFESKELYEEAELDEITLSKFLVQELKIFDQKQLDQSLEILNQKNIFTVKDLTQVFYWEDIEHSLPAHSESLKISIEQFKTEQVKPNKNSIEKKRTQAELIHDWNKVKLFLFYESGLDEIKSNGMLDKEALKLGFEEQRNNPEFDGGPVLVNIEKVLEQYTFPSKPFRKNSHGILLYGPPGTGKTELCSIVIKKAGLFGLTPPLSSSELNRSRIGETEQLLMAIFHRALHLPYLLCCITIDEIDALTPKRTEKSGEQKVDVLCLLLSLIGGIKDVKNVFVIASTNRLNKIDDAFARRLQDKFYIGHLSAEQRIKFIDKIKLPIAQVPDQFKRVFDDSNRINLFKTLTFNFSGAAMVSLRSRLLYFFDKNSSQLLSKDIDTTLIRICSKVANDFQIKIGGFSIPDLLLVESNLNEMELNLKANFNDNDLNRMSGRILIDLRPEFLSIQMEYIDESLKEINLNQNRRFTSDIVTILLQLAMMLDVPYFQLIDSNLALANSAFDENAIIEMILEKLNEYQQYKNSMIVFDADTIVGISESLIDSSAQQDTLSYSFQNGNIWQQIILNSFKSEFASQVDIKHKWCVIISSNEFLINQFKKMTKFEYCRKEEEYLVKERTCFNCKLKYIQKENRRDSCLYHPKRELERIRKPNVTNCGLKLSVSKDSLLEMVNEHGVEFMNDYYYKCCMKRADESDGCRKDYHREKEEPKHKISYANLLKQAPFL